MTLNWDGKDSAVNAADNIPLRLLQYDSALSYGDKNSGNIIVQGDNLDVLKSLLPIYRGQVKCIYIDPPYNTGAAFEHYNDNFPHSDWLNMMYPRLELLREFLSNDGAIFISIDDTEQAYLKIICDEIFGRDNFVTQFISKSKQGKVGTASVISNEHEYITCYAKNFSALKFNMIVTETEGRKENLRQWGQADRREDRPTMFYPIEIDGRKIFPIKTDGTEGRWRVSENTANELLKNNQLEAVNKNGQWNIYRIFSAGKSVMPYGSWVSEKISTTAKGTIALKNLGLNFSYPKPVELIEFILKIATDKNSIVLDSFAGSGTTAHAVINLNKSDGGNRKFILIEEKEYCNTITAERVRRIGGSFDFYRLGEKLLNEYGLIDSAVTFEQLANFIWFSMTKTQLEEKNSPLIGIYKGTAIYLLYREILTYFNFNELPTYEGEKIIYGSACRVDEDFLKENKITFKQIPKDLKIY